MKNWKKILYEMMTDAEGNGLSSKRVIGGLAFLVYVSLAFINTFSGKRTPETFTEGFMWIILGAFFGGTLEYFSRKSNPQAVVKAEEGAKVEVNTSAEPAKPKPQTAIGDAASDLAPNEIIG